MLGLKVSKVTNTGVVIGIYDYTYDTASLETAVAFVDNSANTSLLATTIDNAVLGARASYAIDLKLTAGGPINTGAWDIIVALPSIIDTIPSDISADFDGT